MSAIYNGIPIIYKYDIEPVRFKISDGIYIGYTDMIRLANRTAFNPISYKDLFKVNGSKWFFDFSKSYYYNPKLQDYFKSRISEFIGEIAAIRITADLNGNSGEECHFEWDPKLTQQLNDYGDDNGVDRYGLAYPTFKFTDILRVIVRYSNICKNLTNLGHTFDGSYNELSLNVCIHDNNVGILAVVEVNVDIGRICGFDDTFQSIYEYDISAYGVIDVKIR